MSYGHPRWYPDARPEDDDMPDSKPIGNQDNARRGRGLGPGGRESAPGTEPSGSKPDGKRATIDDVDGRAIGGRGR